MTPNPSENQAVNVAVAVRLGWLDLKCDTGIMQAPNGHRLKYDYPPNYHSDANTRAEVLRIMTHEQKMDLIAECCLTGPVALLELDQPTFFLKVMGKI